VRTAEVAVVVRRGDEFLILHRSPRGGGYWHLVAGGVEPGETAAEAAARELLEEVGLRAPVRPLHAFAYVPTDAELAARPLAPRIEVECFLADAPPAWEPVLDHEHDDHRWCRRDAALDLLFWPEPRDAVALAAARPRPA
jgi:8-oxo-dGTP pyrophosphatase MutT (NUDIX family)